MPIYEYRCTECDHKLEKLQRMSDDPLVVCPECGKPHLKKLVSAAAFKLKGSGWYETDFKDKKTKGDSKSTSESKTQSSKKKVQTKEKTTSQAQPSKSTSSKSES